MQFETQSFVDSFSPTLTRRIEIQFDLLLENLAVGNLVPQLDGSEDFFTVLLDTKSVGGPASARIDFNGLDGIYFYPTGGPSIKFGTYTPSLAQHYSVINYLDENRIEVWQDGVRIYSDRFHYGLDQKLPLSMKGYRLNLTDGRSSALSPVAVIDNLAVRFVPEPGPAGLMAMSCAGYLGFCRRRDRKSREYDRASTR